MSEITTIPLDGTKHGVITVTKIDEPYGAGSGTVASIGVSLAGDAASPEWKVHIPLGSLDAVIAALKSLQ
jgi:diaminopimelate epimerase